MTPLSKEISGHFLNTSLCNKNLSDCLTSVILRDSFTRENTSGINFREALIMHFISAIKFPEFQKIFFLLTRLNALNLFGFSINSIAQTTYWTSYNFSVDPENEETVYNLMDNHFKNNPIDGVTVYLYENHLPPMDSGLLMFKKLPPKEDTSMALNEKSYWNNHTRNDILDIH